jgi:hypothetical protein
MPPSSLALVVALAALCAVTLARLPNPAQTALLTDAVADGAMCLDGSPQRLWTAKAPPGVNATKVLHAHTHTHTHRAAPRGLSPIRCCSLPRNEGGGSYE